MPGTYDGSGFEHWFIIGVMEKKMKTTIVYWGYVRDNGTENGNYYLGFRV